MNDREMDEADVLEQRRALRDEDEPETAVFSEVEANPADLHEQSQPVPDQEEDWPDA